MASLAVAAEECGDEGRDHNQKQSHTAERGKHVGLLAGEGIHRVSNSAVNNTWLGLDFAVTSC